MMVLQVVQQQNLSQNTSLHVSDQIVMLMCVLHLSLNLPLHHMNDCPLMAMNWLKKTKKMMLLQVVQLQHWCQKSSLHVSDQIVMLTSVFSLFMHLPLCHLYDFCLTAMEWTEMMMQMLVLSFRLLLHNWYDCC